MTTPNRPAAACSGGEAVTTPSRPPLWEVLRRAYDTSPLAPMDADDDWTDRHGYAAEIRALRDWLVPEEDKPNDEFCCPPVYTMLWRQNMDLRALLTAEADRAERGDHG